MTGHLDANEELGAHAPSLYAATAATGLRSHPLDGPTRADVAIVGGGYAGLSAAYHLAKDGLDVALIDAHRIGWGASGRNGGQLASMPREDVELYERWVGAENARRIFDLGRDANALVRDLIAEHEIDCELADGILYANHRRRLDRTLAKYVETLRDRYGVEDLDYIAPERMSDHVRARGYSAGALDRRAAHLHPLNFALGLGLAARKAGARLYTMTRALSYETRSGGATVETPVGAIEADALILAVNGYHDGLIPGFERKVAPLASFLIATEPLGDLADELLPTNAAVADTRTAVQYYRLSADGRLIYGAGESASARYPSDIESVTRPKMLATFPQLDDVAIDYAWGGALGITMTRAPLFERIGPSAVAIGGWSGSGVHMATLGGKIAAEAVRGQLERFDLLASVPTPDTPGGPALREPLTRLALIWYGLLDRL